LSIDHQNAARALFPGDHFHADRYCLERSAWTLLEDELTQAPKHHVAPGAIVPIEVTLSTTVEDADVKHLLWL